jgi:hypothetical protein
VTGHTTSLVEMVQVFLGEIQKTPLQERTGAFRPVHPLQMIRFFGVLIFTGFPVYFFDFILLLAQGIVVPRLFFVIRSMWHDDSPFRIGSRY